MSPAQTILHLLCDQLPEFNVEFCEYGRRVEDVNNPPVLQPGESILLFSDWTGTVVPMRLSAPLLEFFANPEVRRIAKALWIQDAAKNIRRKMNAR